MTVKRKINASEVQTGDRIAQMVISAVEQIKWKEVDEINSTARNEGGFGHTGKA